MLPRKPFPVVIICFWQMPLQAQGNAFLLRRGQLAGKPKLKAVQIMTPCPLLLFKKPETGKLLAILSKDAKSRNDIFSCGLVAPTLLLIHLYLNQALYNNR